jgi:EAL domain-containing protein (putative c-di-GMP-specific phosphodiesterase class I)
MRFSALENYLAHLPAVEGATSVWLDAEGRAQGRFFNATLTSAFQPIRRLDCRLDTDLIVGFEGYARSYSAADHGLSVWKLLEQAADDDESIELDRLCRMLHAINFFRQPAAGDADLFLSVDARLLAAVGSNHGMAFRRILQLLELPQERVVLQLPAVAERQGWLLNYVSDNYRRNGFRIAINAANAAEALSLLDRVRPDIVKVDVRYLSDQSAIARLLGDCGMGNIQVVFKRVENAGVLHTLKQLSADTGQPIHAQGFLLDMPKSALAENSPAGEIVLPDSLSLGLRV